MKIPAPQASSTPKVGGQFLEAALESEEVLEMGEILEDFVRGKTRKQRRSNKPRKQTRRQK
jgi:hypothetical protein